MEWIQSNCFCLTSLSAVEWIKAANSSSVSIREFGPARIPRLYPFFRTDGVSALIQCLSSLRSLSLTPFWLRVGNLSDTKVASLLPLDCEYISGLLVWLGVSALSDPVAPLDSGLLSGSSWAAELPRSDDRWRFLSAVYLARLTSA